MKLKLFLFIGFFWFSLMSFSQKTNEYRPNSEMNLEEKEMYEILQKSVSAFLNNKSNAKLFPFFKTYENDKGVVFYSLIYDEPDFNSWDEGTSSATYSVALHFTKRKEIPLSPGGSGHSVTDEPSSERDLKKPIEFYLPVQYSKSNFDFQDITLVSVKKDKPFFDDKYSKVKFTKSTHSNFVNPLIYKIDKSSTISYIDNEIAIYKKDSLFGIVNNKNIITVPFQYQTLRKYKMGILAQQNKSYFFIDSKGTKISKTYDDVKINFNSYFDDVLDYFKVRIGNKYTLVNNNFEEKLPLIYDKIEFFYYKNKPDRLLLERNGKQVIFDIAKWEETNLIFDKIQVIDAKEMIVDDNGKSGIMDFQGTIILPLDYDAINYLESYSSESILLKISKNNKIALYTNRKFLTEFKYDSMSSFFNSIKTEKDKMFGLLNYKGEVLLPIKYESINYNKKTKKIEATKNSVIEYIEFKDLIKN